MSSAQVETAAPSTSMAVPPPPPPPPAVMKKNQQALPAPSSGSNRQSPPTAGRQRSSSLSAAPPSSSSSTSSISPTSSSSSVPTKSISSSSLGSETSSLPPLVPHYTKPAILGLPPSAVLTKQEMDFRANLLNPNNDLFWTARGLIRPPVLADALAQGHAILKHEGHLTQKQGGRRLSAQYGRSGGNGPSASLTSSSSASSASSSQLPMGFGASVINPTSVTAAVQSSWRSAAPAAAPAPPLPSHVTKEEMDFRANRLNPNNDVFWTARGLIRPPVLADALAQGHAILQHEGHLTQTQSHKGRGRLNSLPQSSLYASPADSRASAEPRRSVSGQGLPGSSSASSSGGRSSSWRSERESQPMAMQQRRRASTTGSMMMNRPPALDGSVTKEEVDLRANLMNPNNSIFWTSRGLTRPADLQEALAKGHAVLEAEGHVTHNPAAGGSGAAAGGGRSRSWNRRGSRTELHGPPAVSPLVAAAQRQWSTPFLAPNAGAGPLGAPPSTLTARSGGLPGAAWVHASGGSGPVPSTSRHPDWQASGNIAAQRRRYSLPPPGFELFTPPAHFGLFRPPLQAAKQAAGVAAMPIVREGAADGEWDKMDAEAAAAAAARPPHSAAIPILKPTAADLAKNKAESSSWRKAAPSKPTSSADEEAKAMKQEDKKTTTATATSSTAAAPLSSSKLSTSSGSSPTRMSPSEPTTPGSEKIASPSIDKVGSLAWQLTQVKLRTRRPSEARESEHATKSATA